MIHQPALFAALVLSSCSFAAPPPVALWPVDRPLPTQAELDARSREFEDRLAERMQRMSSRGGCGVTSTELENFEDIVSLATSGLYEPTRIVYIDASAPVGGSGSSWQTAHQSIQDALSAGPYDADLIEFRVAGGTYRADRFSGTDTLDADLSIELPGLTWVEAIDGFVGVKSVKGGYAGRGAKNPDERDLGLYPTVFTGDLLGDDDAAAFSNYADNTKIVFLPSETELNGITIEHARIAAHELRWMTDCTVRYSFASGDDLPIEFDFRAPVFAVEARLVGNTFHNNRGESYGGAIGFEGLTVVANSRFLCNTAPAGGAIASPLADFGPFDESLVVQNTYFASNLADGEHGGIGGAIFHLRGIPRVVHCTFVGNTVVDGLGRSVVWGAFPRVYNCIIDQNFAYDGQGLEASLEVTRDPNLPRIEANIFGRFNDLWQSSEVFFGLRLNEQSDPGFVDLLGSDGLLGTLDDDPSLGTNSIAIGQSVAPPDPASLAQPELLDLADLDADCDIEEPLPVDMFGNPRAIEGAPGEGVDGYAADAGCIEFVPSPDALPGQPWTYIDPMITDFSSEPIRLYVDAQAPEGGDGLSWASAFTNPCPALDIAARRVGPVEIWVASGVYAPICADSGWNSFRLRENVTLLGGFDGTEDSVDQRDWTANSTILSGDVLGNDNIDDESTFEDNAPHVLASLGARGGGVVDGFTIRDGQSLGQFDPFPSGPFFTFTNDGLGRFGDAVAHGHGELIIRNCRIGESNRSVRLGTVGVAGDNTRILIESSVVLAVKAHEGENVSGGTRFGALKAQFPSLSGFLHLKDCTFEFPVPLAQLTSAERALSIGDIAIDRSVFRTSDNTLTSRPLVHLNPPQQLRIHDSLFMNSGVVLRSSDVVVRNSTFSTAGFLVFPATFGVISVERKTELHSNVFDCTFVSFFLEDTVVRGCVFPPTASSFVLESLDDTNLVFDFETDGGDFFVDPLGPDGEPYTGDEDLRLASGSPAINTGLNAFVNSEFDLNGNDRIIGTVVDRGAYEFTGTCTGDVNGDGVIDLGDLNKVLANFGQAVPFGDADASGSVDMTDLSIVLAAFGTDCP